LIVMATYGGSGPLHQVMGSVTEAVNRGAPCPVVTVRAGVRLPSMIQPAAIWDASDSRVGVGAAKAHLR
jgi:Universal stress protein family